MTKRTTAGIVACVAAGLLAIAAPPARGADANAAKPPTQPAVGAEEMKVLRDLEAAGEKYRTIRAVLDYEVTNPLLGDSETRTGWVAYSKGDANAPDRFRVAFETLRQRRGAKTAERIDYAFDGLWLTVAKHRIKNITMYQLAAKGQKVEAFRIGKGPFPMPFGQNAAEMARYFEPRLMKATDSDPKGTVRLRLTTRAHHAASMPTTRMDMWIDTETHLPVKIRSRDKDRRTTTAAFKDIQTNQAVDPGVFTIPTPAGYAVVRKPLGKGGAPAP